MRITTFNTGARYSPEGQRIAFAVLLNEIGGSYLVGFYDADRHVHNVIRIKGEPTKEKVMEAYLYRRYVPEFYLPGPVQDTLRDAALKHRGH